MRTPVQTFVAGIIAIGLVTAMVLPKRQTPAVLNSVFGGSRGLLATAMGTGKKV
jgi:hypothetical protein